MSIPIEVLFSRAIARQFPRGAADLEHPDAAAHWQLEPGDRDVLLFVRRALNAALSNAKIDGLHYQCGPLYFDYIDADGAAAGAFDGDEYSFIGISIPMAKDILLAAYRLDSSADVRDRLPLPLSLADRNSYRFLLMFFGMMFVAAHEYCHHVLGHQAASWAADDPRATSLEGNLQSHTRELAADGYAAMHLLQHVIVEGLRGQAVEMLQLQDQDESLIDLSLFLFLLVAVAATWYHRRPDVLDRDSIYRLTHPPRVIRLSEYMEQSGVWARGFRPSLDGVISGQEFANLMYVVGLAVCEKSDDADSSQQNAFIRSPDGREYCTKLLDNLVLHKSLMGR